MEVSAGIGELSKEAETRSGNRIYEVEGARINLGWEKFIPAPVKPNAKPKKISPGDAIIVLPGWGAKIKTPPVTALGEDFANNSHIPTYAVVAEAEQVHGGGKFLKENVFTSSPYVRMIVPEKAAYHGLPLFRDVARASLGLLERARREM